MIDKRLLQYYTTLDKDFHLSYCEVLEGISSSTIHALRLNVKRQLAFFRLIKVLDKTFPLKRVYGTYHQLIKATNKLRDIKVELELIKNESMNQKLPHNFARRLAEEEELQKILLIQFEKDFSLAPFRDAASTVISRMKILGIEGGILVGFQEYFHEKLDLIKQQSPAIAAVKKRKDLHQFRMEIKELFLNFQLLKKLFPRKRQLDTVIKKVDHLQHLLGDLHDLTITLSIIRKGKKHASKKQQSLVAKERDALFGKVVVVLKDFDLFCQQTRKLLDEIFSHSPLNEAHLKNQNCQEKEHLPYSHVITSLPQVNLYEGYQ